MTNRKGKRRNQVYDTSIQQDADDLALVKSSGLPTDRRYPREILSRLAEIPESQRRNRLIEFTTHRQKLEGSEEREVETTTVVFSDIPSCFHFLPQAQQQAVSVYQGIWSKARPNETVSLSQRFSGGDWGDGYDLDALNTWGRVREQMSKKEAREIERFLTAPDGCLMSVGQSFLVRSGSYKLQEFFENNTLDLM